MLIFLSATVAVLALISLLTLAKIRRLKEMLEPQNLNADIKELREVLEKNFDKNRSEFLKNAANDRQELNNNISQNFTNFTKIQNDNRQEVEKKLDSIRKTVEGQLQLLQKDNAEKLEKMRQTVDEKLHATVEKRFNQSFSLIANRLDQVHKGLGEMQNLASGVGDLKKVLSNVKTRGNIGEIQLGSILEQFFSPAQFEKNVATKASSTQRVEFAIKIPDKNDDRDLLLPIDSKFPIEDYQRLVDIYDNTDYTNQQGSKSAIDQATRQFESSVKKSAKDIYDKYLNPPTTTDFAIMFVPTENLYAEILRNHSLFEELQQKYHVVVLGPTTIVAFLSALQMGFRTLAVEKRSSEVWNVLAAVKSEFGKFGDLLEKTKKKIQETGNVIDQAATKSRVIEKKLKNVEAAPANDDNKLSNPADELIADMLELED